MKYNISQTLCFTGSRPKDLYPENSYKQNTNYNKMVTNVAVHLETYYQKEVLLIGL